MGAKKILPLAEIIVGGSMTGTTTISSPVTYIANIDNIALQVEWTGTAVGTISILLSANNITFYPLVFDPVMNQPAGVAGGVLANINQAAPFYLKVSYTNISSTGTLNAWIVGKDVN